VTSRRLIAPIGGTTTRADCVTALRQLRAVNRLVDGPAIADYERAFAQRVGVRFAVSFASGRVGLYGTLRALGVGASDEVLLQVPTHVVVPNAIRYTGARPIYVDCRPDTFNIDLEDAQRRITPATRVLLIQHTFGIPADLDVALQIAERHGLALVEDCAHALGARYDGRSVGSFGRAGFFSTEEKTISTAMGGMVVTDDCELAAALERFRRDCAAPSALLAGRYLLKVLVFHSITRPAVHPYLRWLYRLLRSRYLAPAATSPEEARGDRPKRYEQRLSNAQAALALGQLRALDANLGHRARVAAAYTARLAAQGFAVPTPPAKSEPAFARYPVLVRDRAAAMEAAAARGAVLGQWLSEVVDGAVPPAVDDYVPRSCPRAEGVVRHVVNLPTHPRVRPDDVDDIVAALADVGPAPRSRAVP
jgi:perosamine synthetase